MRGFLPLLGALWMGCFCAASADAQNGQWSQAADQIPPYATHVDRRHGHDHVYPDRGAIVRDLPGGAIAVNYAGISYWFAGGVWYEPRGPAYMVVTPPIALIVPALPAFATRFESGGKAYLYANDVFYTSRPDLGGYEVVNDPTDTSPEQVASSGSHAPGVAPQPSDGTPPGEPPAAAEPAGTSTADAPAAAFMPANPTRVAIEPHEGQTADRQARDRYECYQRATTQSHFDPLGTAAGASSGDASQARLAYWRAQTACLEGRGYEVR
jgi:hypothetical protein